MASYGHGGVKADPADAIVRKHVRRVEFGWYTDEDTRRRSVVEITSPVAFVETTAIRQGLYDPRMGPSDGKETMPCETCGNRFLTCPGHFGVVELSVPLYQPLLLPDLLAVLSAKCFFCHRLKQHSRQLGQAHAKLLLLLHHRVADYQDMDAHLARVIHRAGQEQLLEADPATSNNTAAWKHAAKTVRERAVEQACHAIITELENQPLPTTAASQTQWSLLMAFRKQLLKEWKAVPQCRHCSAFNPRIKHDQHNKLFQAKLSDKQARVNMAGNLHLKPATQPTTTTTTTTTTSVNYDSDQDTVMSERNPYLDDEAMEVNDDEEEEEEEEEGDDEDGDKPRRRKKPTAKRQSVSTAVHDPDDDDDDRNDTTTETKTPKQFYMPPTEVMAQCQLTWHHHGPLLSTLLFSGKSPLSNPTDSYRVFFCQVVAVPPNRYRPPMTIGAMRVEHAQNQYLNQILVENALVRETLFGSLLLAQANNNNNNKPPLDKNKLLEKGHAHWIQLQTSFNCFMDCSKDPAYSPSTAPTIANGIRQLLEKKEGLFRKHMMGKRVDSACRSVISPDPYVGTNEIGIPLAFAQVLTYPTPVTEWNATELRRLVERGPHQYPGAKWVEIPRPGNKVMRVELQRMNAEKRRAVAAMLLKESKARARPVVVGRQLRQGDVMLVNRQPTLHKPGIMAHQVRILHDPNQKTIRMHYANCNTYNADFDGDEMNCHFPQSDVARAEATYIAQTDLQYIVPTDGTPLRGLIQDHVCGGVKLTTRDTFLRRWEYQQLLFATLSSLPHLEVLEAHQDIELVPPAILKPEPLWTGKQVITTLLLHLCNSPRGQRNRGHFNDDNHHHKRHAATKTEMVRQGGISMERKSKMPASAFGECHEEHLVLIRDGELLRGILDKSAFGATDFSLVHCIYEAYGPQKAGLLLNSLGRLFTAYLQYFAGHSCRVEDLVLTPETDQIRRDLVQRAYNVGSRACKAWADSDGGKVKIEPVAEKEGSNMPLKPVEVASASAKIGRLLGGAQGKENFAALDGYMMSQLNPLASEIIKKCLPNGLAVPFPANTFGLMTTTGAKGSIVNQSQVSCALGQQALEGRRVPRLNSGRTLPSFAPYDLNPRADGFVMDRFLTGVRPQEYYFHCMAGREGLVDTAVKTSRSGYLQRCLMKHLEELKVCYDFTVRNGEGGVIQFLYGEDALDPTKASFLDCTPRSFEFMARNHDSLLMLNTPLRGCSIDIAASDHERSKALTKLDESQLLLEGDYVLARRLRGGSAWARGTMLKGWFEAIVMKAHQHGTLLDLKYIKDGQRVDRVPVVVDLGRCGGSNERAVSGSCVLVKPAVASPLLSTAAGALLKNRGDGKRHLLGSTGACVSERVAGAAREALATKRLKMAMEANKVSRKSIGKLVAAKFANALCAPGEAVGSIAAQSIGEPSTQMTLNTFHLAGAGANVTLGIPRLREIIMTASKKLSTPTMSVPLRDCVEEKAATRLTRSFTKLTLMELLSGDKGVIVKEVLRIGDNGSWERAYLVTLKFHPEERIKAAFGLSLRDIATSVRRGFNSSVNRLMTMELRRSKTESDIGTVKVRGGRSEKETTEDAPEAKDAEDEVEGTTGAANIRWDLGEDEQDSEDEMNVEDGVMASRSRPAEERDAYYGEDDVVQNENPEQDNYSDDEMEETPDGTAKPPIVGEGGVMIDEARNSLSLEPLTVEPSARPLLMVGLIEKAASKHLVRARKSLDQAFVNKEEGRGRCLQTAGVNFEELWRLESSVVDHNRLLSNDIWAIRCAYGVEAACNTIVSQIRGVFGAYGIEVDPRHLTLIADYMTYEGGYKPLNRIGMEEMTSTLLQMSFETTAHFLTQAACGGRKDELESPSANIVLGRPIKHGTGAFDVLVKSTL